MKKRFLALILATVMSWGAVLPVMAEPASNDVEVDVEAESNTEIDLDLEADSDVKTEEGFEVESLEEDLLDETESELESGDTAEADLDESIIEGELIEVIAESQVYAEDTGAGDILPDNDELFAGYVSELFNLDGSDERVHSANLRNTLSEDSQDIYDILYELVANIANGVSSSAIVEIPITKLIEGEPVEGRYIYTPAELGLAYVYDDSKGGWNPELESKFHEIVDYSKIDKARNALMLDHPYEMYWYDKTRSYPYSASYSATWGNNCFNFAIDASQMIEVKMCVSRDYSASGMQATCEANTAKTGAAMSACKNANQIISDASGKSDYDKLDYYREWICKHNTYNSAAAANSSYPYGDPWQLVYVFDGIDETNVVCEGYAKAFQYLCDKTTFLSPAIYCITVEGNGYNSSASGGHMWNIMHMDDGYNYHTDITWCDPTTSDMVDRSNKNFFLIGAKAKVSAVEYIYRDGSYRYDYDQTNRMKLYRPDQLEIRVGTDYDPTSAGELATFDSSSLNVSGKVMLNIFLDLSGLKQDSLSNGYVCVKYDDKRETIAISDLTKTSEFSGGKTYYKLMLQPGMRNLDRVYTVSLFDANDVIIPFTPNSSRTEDGYAIRYSVNDYIIEMINDPSNVGVSSDWKEFLCALAAVGAYSDVYFDDASQQAFKAKLTSIIGAENVQSLMSKASEVSFETLSDYQRLVSDTYPTEKHPISGVSCVEGLEYMGSSLIFNSPADNQVDDELFGDISIRNYYKLTGKDHSISDYKIMLDGVNKTDLPCKSNCYYVEIGNIPPARYDSIFLTDVEMGNFNLFVNYSVNSYFYDAIKRSNDPKLSELAKYMYIMGKDADAVF